jgi:flavin reductase (DIM6/NTAB) family NADH-FMN oxidoreductase RutF
MTSDDFRETLKDFPAGVTIVTSAGRDGVPVGATVSSFTSLSLDPPLILVCLKSESRTVEAIRQRGAFAVHILERSQAQLARQFAADHVDKFQAGTYGLNGSGVPYLLNCQDRLDCSLENEFTGGDHQILVGRVEAISRADGFEPLVYAQRGFFELGGSAAEA